MIKTGALAHARILLENGASIKSFAVIARYGGSRLDIPAQAINCFAGDYGDPETASIGALKLLREFHYHPIAQEIEDLVSRTRDRRPRVTNWIKANLSEKS